MVYMSLDKTWGGYEFWYNVDVNNFSCLPSLQKNSEAESWPVENNEKKTKSH